MNNLKNKKKIVKLADLVTADCFCTPIKYRKKHYIRSNLQITLCLNLEDFENS